MINKIFIHKGESIMANILKNFDAKKQVFSQVVYCLALQESRFLPAMMQKNSMQTVQQQCCVQNPV